MRLTFEDTFNWQNELISLIEKKEERNTPFSEAERTRARHIFPRAILSHGSNTFSFRNKDGKVSLFRHVSSFFSKLSKMTSSSVVLLDTQTSVEYTVSIRELWGALLEELEYLFPFAREEAIHMSAEAPVRERSSSFEFSLDNDRM